MQDVAGPVITPDPGVRIVSKTLDSNNQYLHSDNQVIGIAKTEAIQMSTSSGFALILIGISNEAEVNIK